MTQQADSGSGAVAGSGTSGRALEFSLADGIAHVTLKGPGQGNALGPDFWSEGSALFEAIDSNPDIRATVLSGAGANFTYGLDLVSMTGELSYALAESAMAAERTRFLDRLVAMQRVIISMMSCRKPIVASISGWCVGAGIDIICAADIRVCSSEAMFSARAVRIGIVEDMGSLQRLPAIIGDGNAREICLTGEDFDASRAKALGLVGHIEPTPDAALQRAEDIARRIAANPPLTVQGVKRVMNERALAGIRESLHYNALWNAAFMQSRDFAEAIRAFTEKREPRFEGR
jgi:enoyl-CoA hydratase